MFSENLGTAGAIGTTFDSKSTGESRVLRYGPMLDPVGYGPMLDPVGYGPMLDPVAYGPMLDPVG